MNSFNEIKELFADPPANYRTMPFWVWNEKVTKEMIDEQLPDYKDKGFGGIFVHPRYGLITEYASEDWYELVAYATKKADKLGMKLWLYDENSFPSGFAGGHVPDQMPESYNQGTAMKKHEMEIFDPDTVLEWIAFFKKEGDHYVGIGDDFKSYTGKKGKFIGIEKRYFESSKWFGGFSYVDLIYPGVTEKFIDITMSGYEEKIGDEFGKVVPGIFTDEPNINPRERGTLRWTPDLFEVFQNTWGYNLESNLMSLFYETGDWTKIRHDYYSVLLDLFIERWAKPWNEYTESKGLKWTGHYWEHGWPDPIHGGDNMAMYPYHQVPGIDMLFNTRDSRPDQFGNVRAVKELSSIANQFGRSRTLSETYGASGYELNFEDMKRNGDWEYALGVNFMNQHLSYQSMLGDRKHDFPQTFSYHTIWWDDYRAQADYFARLSLALSSGYQVNNVLVIEPTTSAWMYYVPGTRNEMINDIKEEFHMFINDLEYYKLEYDLAAEKTMRDFGNVRDNKLVISDRAYSLIVLPPGLTNLDRSSFAMLEEFLSSGGKILSFCDYPSYIDGEAVMEVQDLFIDYPEQVDIEKELSQSAVSMLSEGSLLTFDPLAGANLVYYMHRQLSDGDLIFLSNYDIGKQKEFSLTIEDARFAVELDPVDGKIYETDFERSGEGLNLNVSLENAGSRLYFISPSRIKAITQSRDTWVPDSEEEIFISGIQRHGPNVLVLNYCYLEFPDEEKPSDELIYYYKAHDRIFQKHGFPDNPWVSSSQFKTEIIDRDTFGMNSGFKVSFPFFVNEGADLSSVNVVVERPELYSVFLNEKLLQPEKDNYYIDKGTGLYPGGSAVRIGHNMVTLIAQPFSVYQELAPVFITGNFSVQPSSAGWEIAQEVPLSTGSWIEYGLPFYPEDITYYADFTMEKPLKAKLSLGKWTASCITLSVNDSEEILVWPPYEPDISQYLKEGENSLKITLNGSLKNLIGPHHNVSRKGIVTPWSFKYGPEEIPPGKDYDLVDYGLFSVPEILK